MPESIQLMFTDADCVLAAEPVSTLLSKLHESQRSRYKSITNSARRKTWLMGRALLAAAVEHRYGHCNSGTIRTDPHGGILLDGIDAEVSMSHSHNMGVVSLSRTRVGVDLEYKKKRRLVRHTSKLFAPAESGHLHKLTNAEQLEAFYIYWTLKEAVCKASAIPLLTCLQNACFDLQSHTFRLHKPFLTQDWCFMSAPVELEWRMALAMPVTSVVPRIESWKLVPGRQWRKFHLDQCIFMPATEVQHDQ